MYSSTAKVWSICQSVDRIGHRRSWTVQNLSQDNSQSPRGAVVKNRTHHFEEANEDAGAYSCQGEIGINFEILGVW